MRVLKDIEQVRNFCDLMHSVGKKIGFVPTMGNLHDGHLSLVERAKKENNVVGVSIFVNPIQFGPNEDFNKYPRTLDEDIEKLKSVGCDFVFVPDTSAMYLNNSSELIINEKKISKTMCGKFRQGHFDGVLTVVAKLFHICKPDKAYFGNKDYQQLILIKQMSLSLNMGVEIIGCPLVRERDGLAMSSRNSYLDSEARKKALKLSKALFLIKESFDRGNTDVNSLKKIGLETLMPDISVQYLEIVKADDLSPVLKVEKGCLVAIAGYCGPVRLIDNIIL